jgi:elongation factor G
VRKGTIAEQLVPVFVGSAYKNKGVQLLLNGVVDFLPDPTEVKNIALDLDNNEKLRRWCSKGDKLPTVALAFKLEDGQYGQLTYVRIYQGAIKKGDELINTRSRKKFKVGRLVRMHAAFHGRHQRRQPRRYRGPLRHRMRLRRHLLRSVHQLRHDLDVRARPGHLPGHQPQGQEERRPDVQGPQPLHQGRPTFQTYVDPESNQTIIKGMGELHLDVYIERMKREYKCEVETGMPQVAYRETISQRADFNYTHKKQTGGSGQYGRVAGFMEPCEEKVYEFVDSIKGGAIPNEYIPSCDKGFKEASKKGGPHRLPRGEHPLTINDGAATRSTPPT